MQSSFLICELKFSPKVKINAKYGQTEYYISQIIFKEGDRAELQILIKNTLKYGLKCFVYVLALRKLNVAQNGNLILHSDNFQACHA